MDLGDAKITIGLDTKDFQNGLTGVSNKLDGFAKNFGQKMTQMGKNLSMKVTAPLVALGVGAFKMAGDFDTAMRKVNVMLKASDEEFENYKDEVLAISNATGIAATDVADAFYQIVSAGYRGEDAIAILNTAMKGAVGGMADAEMTAAALTKAMNIFELEGVGGSERAMDTFFGIVDAGLLTFEQLSQSFPRAATMAGSLGITIEETGSALATLTKVTGSEEEAATSLNGVFTQLVKPSAELQALYEEWGVKTGPEAIEKFGGLEGMLLALTDATGGEVDALAELFPNIEAIKAILPLTTTLSDDFAAAQDNITESVGKTGEAYEEMTEGPGFQWNQMMITVKNGMIELGDTISETLGPWIQKLIDWVKSAFEWFGNLPEPMKKITIGIGLMAAAIGPLLLIGGQMVKAFGSIVTAGGKMITFIFARAIPALIKLAAGFIATLAAMGPVGWALIAGAAAAAGAGIYALTKLLGVAQEAAPVGETYEETLHKVITVSFSPSEGRQNELPVEPEGYYWAYQGEVAPGRHRYALKPVGTFQYGGIVPGPIGQPVPIIAHGGEEYAGVGRSIGNTIILNIEGSVVAQDDLLTYIRRGLILTGEREFSTGIV